MFFTIKHKLICLSAILLCCEGFQCEDGKTNESLIEKGSKVDDRTIEKLLSEGNSEVFARNNIPNIVRKEYPFIHKYIKSPNSEVRWVTVCFLVEAVHQPWCYKWYLIALEDSRPQIRVTAAEGIFQLKNVGNVDEIYKAITNEMKKFPPEDNIAVPVLIKVIGNIGSNKDIVRLKSVIENIKTNELIMSDIQKSLLAALTKLGDKDAVQSVEKKLTMGTSEDKMEALEIVEYTKHGEWIPTVVELLRDKSVAMSFELGNARVSKRVCDFAANTLLFIDPEKKLNIQPLGPFPYSDQVIAEVKKMYGIEID